MNGFPSTPPPAANLGDVYFTVFRHKWKMLGCLMLGLVAAGAYNRFNPPPFQSEAKLFVRYVVSEGKAMGPGTGEITAKSPDQQGETIMKSEAEILGSLDIAKQVAEVVGPEKIVPGSRGDSSAAAAQIKNHLLVYVAPGSSVINITYAHPDAAIVQPVLREVIERYRRLHVETHTASGTLGDYLSQETDHLRSRLAQTEDDLRKATLKAGIISLEDARKAQIEQLAGIRRELFTAQTDLAQRQAMLAELTRHFPRSDRPPEALPPVSAELAAAHADLVRQTDRLRQMELESLTQFTPESTQVREIRGLLAAAWQGRRRLEQEHPGLEGILAARHDPETGGNPAVVEMQVTTLQAKVAALTTQLEEVRRDAAKVDLMEGPIVELRRKRELEDANYRYYSASLEQARINETFGNGRVSNISQIQAPSPPFSDRRRTDKMLGMIFGAGLLGGIAWAFLIELYFDRSVKRPVDLERTLQVPLLLAIPQLTRRQLGGFFRSRRLAAGSDPAVAPGTPDPLQVYHETLRDRLIAYFESVNLTHKPKLVAVTALGTDAGVSTAAAGLARSLSETGEGNVLLVDMNDSQGEAKQFVKGRPAGNLDQFLDTREHTSAEPKLYMVTDHPQEERLARNIPQRFSKLVPKLKASDFDYIIFDMPPISQISITPRLAGFMDMVLLVVEAEKTNRDLVQRATAMLSETRAHVGVVLNKTRRYIPAALYQDHLSSS